MEKSISIKIKTLSNLLIGGAPTPFEIGGIDQQTTVDSEGYPCIPGSSMKGALRAIVREDKSESANKIAAYFKQYLERQREGNRQRVRDLLKEEEAIQRFEERYDAAIQQVSAEYLFGIEGINQTPKLLFGDLYLCKRLQDRTSCFSIDMKNAITTGNDKPVSNPRSYKTARCGLEFEGEIRLYHLQLLGDGAEELCKSYLIAKLKEFNGGVYRLGNSKSRGYGKIEVTIVNESGA